MKKFLKVLLITILLLTLSTSVNAEVETKDRNTLDNLGVNKKWTITEKNRDNVLATPKVDSSEKIYDFENVLSEEDKTKLKTQIDEYMEKTGFELIIVIKDLPYTEDTENEDFAVDFYDYNDFALELKHYSGSLLLRNTYEQDPYYNIYTFGEAQLYYRGNERDDIILDGIYNDLHNKNYYEGFSRYIELLNEYYDQGIAPELSDYYIDENGFLRKPPEEYSVPYVFIFLFSLTLTLITIGIMIAKNKMIHKATEARDYLDKSLTNYTSKTDNLISTHTTHHIISSSSSSGGGGGFSSSSGSSGGGHSSGGGRHG